MLDLIKMTIRDKTDYISKNSLFYAENKIASEFLNKEHLEALKTFSEEDEDEEGSWLLAIQLAIFFSSPFFIFGSFTVFLWSFILTIPLVFALDKYEKTPKGKIFFIKLGIKVKNLYIKIMDKLPHHSKLKEGGYSFKVTLEGKEFIISKEKINKLSDLVKIALVKDKEEVKRISLKDTFKSIKPEWERLKKSFIDEVWHKDISRLEDDEVFDLKGEDYHLYWKSGKYYLNGEEFKNEEFLDQLKVIFQKGMNDALNQELTILLNYQKNAEQRKEELKREKEAKIKEKEDFISSFRNLMSNGVTSIHEEKVQEKFDSLVKDKSKEEVKEIYKLFSQVKENVKIKDKIKDKIK